MIITSLNFLYLLLFALIVYYLLPLRPQNYWLLLVSYAFYMTWSWHFALALLLLTCTNFYLAQRLRVNEQSRPTLLWTGISLNVGAWLCFRIADFYLPEVLKLLSRVGLQTETHGLEILLPVGLAYYALQNISYLVDVYRGQLKASTNLVDFALYLAYFPKLLSGPIERARIFLPKLANRREVDNEVLTRSMTILMIGLLRKLLVADTISSVIFWDAFETPANYTGPELIGLLLLYGLFLYNDFAGYTGIVRGVSGLFGIELSPNFKQPYFARSFTEFWNSWHITLSHWLRDYIYFPISRALVRRNPSQRNVPNLILPPLITMLVSGLWHGPGWHMLLWGFLHGLYQIVERLPLLWRPIVPPQRQPWWRQGLSMGIVFTLVSLAWVPFVMELPVAFAYWRGMFDWTYTDVRYWRILTFVPCFGFTVALDWMQHRYRDEAPFLGWPRLAQASLLAAFLFLLVIMIQIDYEVPFVYQGF
jgi:alginate O-acetyltransferase complex protein AlgI